MKKFVLCFLIIFLGGCRLLGTSKAVQDMHNAEQKSMRNYAGNMDIIVKELMSMYRISERAHAKYRHSVALDKAQVISKTIEEYRGWEAKAGIILKEKYEAIDIIVAKVSKDYDKALLDYKDVSDFFKQMSAYLAKKTISKEDLMLVTDEVLKQLKGK